MISLDKNKSEEFMALFSEPFGVRTRQIPGYLDIWSFKDLSCITLAGLSKGASSGGVYRVDSQSLEVTSATMRIRRARRTYPTWSHS
jgi:hypothetical protein